MITIAVASQSPAEIILLFVFDMGMLTFKNK